MQQWLARAPANIALIKYMGKKDSTKNLPANASLSFTLQNLQSNVSLESHLGGQDFWEPLEIPGIDHFVLSTQGQERFLKHLGFLKQHFDYNGGFIVRSNNTFPLSTGLASSASSFAALTKCAVRAICELTKHPEPSTHEIANLSRQGSGSSCRSFFAPWALWEADTVSGIDLPYGDLFHEVILVSHEIKTISSAQAHELIKTSPHFSNRPERAQQNLQNLIDAMRARNWPRMYAICWQEFQDMHNLFATCKQPFSYMTPQTLDLLDQLRATWDRNQDGPLITMDAGPNIHLLYRSDQKEMARRFKQDVLIGNFDVM